MDGRTRGITDSMMGNDRSGPNSNPDEVSTYGSPLWGIENGASENECVAGKKKDDPVRGGVSRSPCSCSAITEREDVARDDAGDARACGAGP